jgi:hypothetical protein
VAPSLLPHVAEALAGVAENIFVVQIFFELPAVDDLQTSCAEDGSRVNANEPGEAGFPLADRFVSNGEATEEE